MPSRGLIRGARVHTDKSLFSRGLLVDSRGVCSTCFATHSLSLSTSLRSSRVYRCFSGVGVYAYTTRVHEGVPLCISRYMHGSIEAYRRRYSPSFAVDNIRTDKGTQACSPKGSSSPASENAPRIQREPELRPEFIPFVHESRETSLSLSVCSISSTDAMTINALQCRTKRYFRFNWKDGGKRFSRIDYNCN